MICSHCNTKLVTFKYVGYYDEFYGYKCACEFLPKEKDSKFIKGAYAMCGDEWNNEPEYVVENYRDATGKWRHRRVLVEDLA